MPVPATSMPTMSTGAAFAPHEGALMSGNSGRAPSRTGPRSFAGQFRGGNPKVGSVGRQCGCRLKPS